MDMEAIARTIAIDFPAAVRAEKKAQSLAIDAVLEAVQDAQDRRAVKVMEARRMQEEAAKIAASSIRLIEQADEEYWTAMRAATSELHKLRGPSIASRADSLAIGDGSFQQAAE